MPIDHLVYAVPALAIAVADLDERLGVRARAGGRHVGLGTHNALVGLGAGMYLEIIAPDPDAPDPAGPRPFGLDENHSPQLTGWAVRCHDIDAVIAAWRAHGYDPGDAVPMQRESPDGRLLQWRLTRNARAGRPEPFLIDWGDTDHPSRSAPSGLTLEALEIRHPDPGATRALLEPLDVDVRVTAGPELRFVAYLRGPHGEHELQ